MNQNRPPLLSRSRAHAGTRALRLALLCAAGLAWRAPAAAQAPALLPVQGYLTDDAGVPIDGTAELALSLHDAASGGNVVFSETQDVEVQQGAFTAYLGEVEALDLSLFADAGALWLGVAIDGDPELSPRFQLASVPYAAHASICGDASTLAGMGAAAFAAASHGHAWSELSGIPADLADGDDGATYTAGAGIAIDGANQISVLQSTVEGWARGVALDTEGELTALLDDNYLAASYTPAWGDLDGVPAELADGDDSAATACAAGEYLDGSGSCVLAPGAILVDVIAAAQNGVAPLNYARVVTGVEVRDPGDDHVDGVFTAPVAGYYQLSASLSLSNISPGSRVLVAFQITSSGVGRHVIDRRRVNTQARSINEIAGFSGSKIARLAAGDTVELVINHDDAAMGGVTVQGGSGVQIAYLRGL